MTKKKNRVKNEIVLLVTNSNCSVNCMVLLSKIKRNVLKSTMRFYYFLPIFFYKVFTPRFFCSVAYFSGFFYRNVGGIPLLRKKVQQDEFQSRLDL